MFASVCVIRGNSTPGVYTFYTDFGLRQETKFKISLNRKFFNKDNANKICLTSKKKQAQWL